MRLHDGLLVLLGRHDDLVPILALVLGHDGLLSVTRQRAGIDEHAVQFQALLDDPGQPADGLGDGFRRLEAEVHAHGVLAGHAIGEEGVPWHIGYARLQRLGKHRIGIHIVRQGDPEEHAAGGMGPGGLGREELVQGRQHGVASLLVQGDELLQRALPGNIGEVVLHHELVEGAAAQIGPLLHQVDAGEHRFRRRNPARAQARPEHLRDSAQVDDRIVHGLQGHLMAAVVAQATVGVVLHHHEAVLVGQLQQAAPALGVHGHPAGILEIRDGVAELQARIALADALEFGLQEIHAHAVLVEGNGADIGLEGGEGLQRPQIGGALGDDDVARVDEGLGDEREGLLGPRCNENLVSLHANAQIAHHIGEHGPQAGQAVGGAVLQRHGPGLGTFHRGQHGAAHVLLRQKRHGGHAARQRDHVVARGGGEEVAHRRGSHDAHAMGDLVARGVEGDVS